MYCRPVLRVVHRRQLCSGQRAGSVVGLGTPDRTARNANALGCERRCRGLEPAGNARVSFGAKLHAFRLLIHLPARSGSKGSARDLHGYAGFRPRRVPPAVQCGRAGGLPDLPELRTGTITTRDGPPRRRGLRCQAVAWGCRARAVPGRGPYTGRLRRGRRRSMVMPSVRGSASGSLPVAIVPPETTSLRHGQIMRK